MLFSWKSIKLELSLESIEAVSLAKKAGWGVLTISLLVLAQVKSKLVLPVISKDLPGTTSLRIEELGDEAGETYRKPTKPFSKLWISFNEFLTDISCDSFIILLRQETVAWLCPCRFHMKFNYNRFIRLIHCPFWIFVQLDERVCCNSKLASTLNRLGWDPILVFSLSHTNIYIPERISHTCFRSWWVHEVFFFLYDSTIAFNMLVSQSSQQYEVVHAISAQSFHASQMREQIAQKSRKGNWIEHLDCIAWCLFHFYGTLFARKSLLCWSIIHFGRHPSSEFAKQ